MRRRDRHRDLQGFSDTPGREWQGSGGQELSCGLAAQYGSLSIRTGGWRRRDVTYAQTDRILEIQTTLGADKAMLTELDGEERLSHPYLFSIRFVSDEPAESVAKLLGSAVSIRFGWPEDASGLARRPLHGHILRLRRGMPGAATGSSGTPRSCRCSGSSRAPATAASSKKRRCLTSSRRC